MQSEITSVLATTAWVVLAMVGVFVLGLVLAAFLHKRTAPGLVPGVFDQLHLPDANWRLIALLGHRARVPETLGTLRLRATFGLKLLFWALTAGLIWLSLQTAGLMPFLAFVLYLAIHTTLYEISYDHDTITLPRWWFGRKTHKWRDLDAAVDRMGWFVDFHFRDGTVIQAHKYIVGYSTLRERAALAMRED
ncbi:MAG: hypothetical protein WAT09_13820 [Paracoccaceae bacterium]